MCKIHCTRSVDYDKFMQTPLLSCINFTLGVNKFEIKIFFSRF